MTDTSNKIISKPALKRKNILQEDGQFDIGNKISCNIKPEGIRNPEEDKINFSSISRFKDWSPEFLCDFIVINHHGYIKNFFPEIIFRIKNLCREKKELKPVKEKLLQLFDDFEIHMNREEKMLFPYVKNLVKTEMENSEFEIPPFGSVSDLIKLMTKEHVNASIQIRNIIFDYTVICNKELKQKKFYEFGRMLEEFKSDFIIHTNLEDKYLFPKSISMENKLKRKLKNHKLNNKNQKK